MTHQSDDDVLFQLVLFNNHKLIATGGLCYKVNLLNVYSRFNQLGPWVALLYTEENYRNQGFGKMLLKHIEQGAKEHGLSKIYLYTFTAESLYRRSGWKPLERVPYKGHNTVVMEKYLNVL